MFIDLLASSEKKFTLKEPWRPALPWSQQRPMGHEEPKSKPQTRVPILSYLLHLTLQV